MTSARAEASPVTSGSGDVGIRRERQVRPVLLRGAKRHGEHVTRCTRDTCLLRRPGGTGDSSGALLLVT